MIGQDRLGGRRLRRRASARDLPGRTYMGNVVLPDTGAAGSAARSSSAVVRSGAGARERRPRGRGRGRRRGRRAVRRAVRPAARCCASSRSRVSVGPDEPEPTPPEGVVLVELDAATGPPPRRVLGGLRGAPADAAARPARASVLRALDGRGRGGAGRPRGRHAGRARRRARRRVRQPSPPRRRPASRRARSHLRRGEPPQPGHRNRAQAGADRVGIAQRLPRAR